MISESYNVKIFVGTSTIQKHYVKLSMSELASDLWVSRYTFGHGNIY